MSIADAEKRLTLSRHALADWTNYGSEETPQDTLLVIDEERRILDKIAHEHPESAMEAEHLSAEWRTFAETVRVVFH